MRLVTSRAKASDPGDVFLFGASRFSAAGHGGALRLLSSMLNVAITLRRDEPRSGFVELTASGRPDFGREMKAMGRWWVAGERSCEATELVTSRAEASDPGDVFLFRASRFSAAGHGGA